MPDVRIATAADVDEIFELCQALWAENSVFPMNEQKVLNIIRDATSGGAALVPTVIGVLGPPGGIEGSIALVAAQSWYTDAWHLEELWNFVKPQHRNSRNAAELLAFAKETQKALGLPLMIGVLSATRTEAKVRYYERVFGKKAGVYFVWPSWSTLHQQVTAPQQDKQ